MTSHKLEASAVGFSNILLRYIGDGTFVAMVNMSVAFTVLPLGHLSDMDSILQFEVSDSNILQSTTYSIEK